MRAPKPSKRSLHHDRGGAALVEFAFVLMPLLSGFFSFTQIGRMYTAKMMLDHSATIAARAGAVILNSNGNINPQPSGVKTSDPHADVQNATRAALGSWINSNSFDNVQTSIDDRSSESDPYGKVCVTVTANYRCRIPLGGSMVCGFDRKTPMKSPTVCHAHQGARYKSDSDSKG